MSIKELSQDACFFKLLLCHDLFLGKLGLKFSLYPLLLNVNDHLPLIVGNLLVKISLFVLKGGNNLVFIPSLVMMIRCGLLALFIKVFV